MVNGFSESSADRAACDAAGQAADDSAGYRAEKRIESNDRCTGRAARFGAGCGAA